MKADLLLDLANFLDNLPPQRFRYSKWVGNTWARKPDLSCGTTACALGWATQIPSIKALGLHLVWDVALLAPYITDRTDGSPIEGDSPNAEAIASASRVFEISEREARFLFLPDHYLNDEEGNVLRDSKGRLLRAPDEDASAITVAAHIRDFLLLKQNQPSA